MRGLGLNDKSTVLVLRWTTILLVVLLMLYSREGLTFGTGAYLLGVAFFLSNIVFTLIPRQYFARPAVSSIIVIMDAGFISLAIYLTSGFNTDFYLVYFFIILIAAMRQELKGSIVTGAISITLYGLLIYRTSPDFSILNTPFLIRAVFLLLIATFSGYLAQRARVYEEARDVAHMRLKDAEEKLLRSERLAIIGQLAASVGHELRNPLGALHNSLYLLGLKLSGGDERVTKQLRRMETDLRRCNKIISDLLDFSRDREASMHPTDISQLIEQALDELDTPEGVEVVKDLQDVPSVMADSDQLHSVFTNLISNAIQAMPEGGTLTVKTGGNGRHVEAHICDTGVGIADDQIHKIFEPLFTTRAQGIGLGLCVCKRFIDNHGGEIRVSSRRGEGSTFSLRLPGKSQKE